MSIVQQDETGLCKLHPDRERTLSSEYYWLEESRLRLVGLLGVEPDRVRRTDLADRLGIKKSGVSKFLNGDGDFKMSTYIKIALELGYIPLIHFVRKRTAFEYEAAGCDIHSKVVLGEQEMHDLFRLPTNGGMTLRYSNGDKDFVSMSGETIPESFTVLLDRGIKELSITYKAPTSVKQSSRKSLSTSDL